MVEHVAARTGILINSPTNPIQPLSSATSRHGYLRKQRSIAAFDHSGDVLRESQEERIKRRIR